MIQAGAGDVFQISMLPIPWRLQSLKQRGLLGAFFCINWAGLAWDSQP